MITVSRARTKVSRTDKESLLRIVKRPRRGPFKVIMDPFDRVEDTICGTCRLSETSARQVAHGSKRMIKVGVSPCVVNVAHVRSQKPDLGHP